MELYKTVRSQAEATNIIEKSRFIAHVKPVSSKEEADAFVAEIKGKYKDATHNVPAMVIGDKFQIQWASDDGEPQGTAGLPVFNVLAKKNLQNVLVIVTRYFGGILLGKGGLIRAYTEATVKAIESANVYEIVEYEDLEIICEYNIKDKILFFLEKSGYGYSVTYYEKVKCRIHLPSADLSNFVDEVIKFTENRISYEILSK